MRKWILISLTACAFMVLGLPYLLGFVAQSRLNHALSVLVDSGSAQVQQEYHRGWFHSEALIILTLDDQESLRLAPQLMSLMTLMHGEPITLNLKAEIKHGPLFFDSFKLQVGQALANFTLFLPPDEQARRFEPPTIVAGKSHIRLTGASFTEIISPQFEHNSDQTQITLSWSDLSLKVRASRNLRHLNLKWHVNDMTISDRGVSLNISKVKGDHDYEKIKKYNIWIGSSNIDFPFVLLTVDGKNKMILRELRLQSGSERSGHVLNIALSGSLDKLLIDTTSYGPGNFDLDISNVDIRALSRLKKVLNGPDADKLTQQQKGELLSKLLARGFRVHLSDLTLELPDGEIGLYAWLTLPDTYKKDSETFMQSLQRAEGAASINMPQTMVEKFVQTSLLLEQHSLQASQNADATPAMTKKEARRLARRKLLSWVSGNFIQADGNNYRFSADYKQNKVYLNGKLYEGSLLEPPRSSLIPES